MIASPSRDAMSDPSAEHDPFDLVVGMSLEPLVAPSAEGVVAAAESCITRFAASEADVTTAELHGLGRVSGARFPRLGGVLHGRVAAGGRAAELVLLGVERTVRAGYQAAVATEQVAGEQVQIAAADALWDAFVPLSYRMPRSVAGTAWELCRFDDFWVSLLVELGMAGDASRFAKGRASALSRSIRGLSTVGVALAVAERGGRYDRAVFGRPVRREPRRRSHGRALPPAPRLRLVDPV